MVASATSVHASTILEAVDSYQKTEGLHLAIHTPGQNPIALLDSLGSDAEDTPLLVARVTNPIARARAQFTEGRFYLPGSQFTQELNAVVRLLRDADGPAQRRRVFHHCIGRERRL